MPRDTQQPESPPPGWAREPADNQSSARIVSEGVPQKTLRANDTMEQQRDLEDRYRAAVAGRLAWREQAWVEQARSRDLQANYDHLAARLERERAECDHLAARLERERAECAALREKLETLAQIQEELRRAKEECAALRELIRAPDHEQTFAQASRAKLSAGAPTEGEDVDVLGSSSSDSSSDSEFVGTLVQQAMSVYPALENYEQIQEELRRAKEECAALRELIRAPDHEQTFATLVKQTMSVYPALERLDSEFVGTLVKQAMSVYPALERLDSEFVGQRSVSPPPDWSTVCGARGDEALDTQAPGRTGRRGPGEARWC
eukprot:COSAG02_NODE_669_length_18681_cov_170.310499_12_plen_320_part_00